MKDPSSIGARVFSRESSPSGFSSDSSAKSLDSRCHMLGRNNTSLDYELPEKLFGEPHFSRRTGFHSAVSIDNKNLISELLAAGNDISYKDSSGRTPLHDAVARGQDSIVRLLLWRGVDSSCQDNNGNTPLHIAVKIGNYSIVRLLVQSGADISSKDKNGHTALNTAVNNGEHSITNLLLQSGADPKDPLIKGSRPIIQPVLNNRLTAPYDAANTPMRFITPETGTPFPDNGDYTSGYSVPRAQMKKTYPLSENGGQSGNARPPRPSSLEDRLGLATRTDTVSTDPYLQRSSPLTNTTTKGVECELTAECDPGGILVHSNDDSSYHDCPFHPGLSNSLSKSGDTRICGGEGGKLSINRRDSISLQTPIYHTPTAQPKCGRQNDSGSPKPTTQSKTTFSDTLSKNPSAEIPFPSIEDATSRYNDDGDEDNEDDDEDDEDDDEDDEDDDDNDDDDGDGDGDDDGDDGNDDDELEDYDRMETTRGSNNFYPKEVPSGTDTGYSGSCNDEETREGKGKENISRKRSMPQNTSDESKTPDRAPKKQKKGKGAQTKSANHLKKPFACPYYKKFPLENPNCADWCNIKLDIVKDHCKSAHLGFRCPRCKEYRVQTQEQINQHLDTDDCSKPEAYDSSQDTLAKEKGEEIKKARTWQKIYEILFPLHIPDPFWKPPIEVIVSAITEDEGLSPIHRDNAMVPLNNKQAYQQGLMYFLSDRLRLPEGHAEKLLGEYDKKWVSKTCNQVSSDTMDDSSTEPHYPPAVPLEIQKPSTPKPVHGLTDPQYGYKHPPPEEASGGSSGQHYDQSTVVDNIPSQPCEVQKPINTSTPGQTLDYSQAGSWGTFPWPDSQLPINASTQEPHLNGHYVMNGLGNTSYEEIISTETETVDLDWPNQIIGLDWNEQSN